MISDYFCEQAYLVLCAKAKWRCETISKRISAGFGDFWGVVSDLLTKKALKRRDVRGTH